MKKTLAIITALMIVFSFTGISVLAAASPSVIMSSAVCYQDSVAHIVVSLENNPGISSMELLFKYDSTYISLDSIMDMNAVGKAEYSSDFTANPFLIAINSDTQEDASGAILQLSFSIKSDAPAGTYDIELVKSGFSAKNTSGKDVAFTLSSSKIIVKAKLPVITNTSELAVPAQPTEPITATKPVDQQPEAPQPPVVKKALTANEDRALLLKDRTVTIRIENTEPWREVEWVSSDTAIAQVNQYGKITAVEYGTCTIMCRYKDDPETYAKIAVQVCPKTTSAELYYNGMNVTNGTAAVDYYTTGNTPLLAVKTYPAGASTVMTWTSTNEDVATVTASGVIVPKGEGYTVIEAETTDFSNIKIAVRLNVAKLVRKVEITGNCDAVTGHNVKLVGKAYPEDASITTLKWTTSDKSIATVDSAGNVYPKSVTEKKTVTITATAADLSHVSQSVDIDVYPATKKILLSKNNVDVTGKSVSVDIISEKNFKLEAATEPIDSMQNVVWTSDNPKVAEVDQNGNVTLLSVGTVNISTMAQDGTKRKASVKINSVVFVGSLSVVAPECISAGQSTNLTAQALPITAKDKRVKWSVSNLQAAKISSGGKLTALNVTEATEITVTAFAMDESGVKAETKIMIYPAVKKVGIYKDEVAVTEKSLNISLSSESIKLVAINEPDSSVQEVLWTSTKDKIATVDGEGNVSLLAKGNTIIIAKANDGSGSKAVVRINIIE